LLASSLVVVALVSETIRAGRHASFTSQLEIPTVTPFLCLTGTRPKFRVHVEAGGRYHRDTEMRWQLALSRHRKARVWLDEVPSAEFEPTGFVRREVSRGSSPIPAKGIAAVELMVPRGATASYGLLGAQMLDSERHVGEVTVGILGDGPPMLDSLALMPDNVRVGLLEEYVDGVVLGVKGVVKTGWHFEGNLHFRWAAHGTVGSSSAFFAEIASLVARLLSGATSPTPGDIVRLFE
jgi:hypothetical protein